MPKIIHITLDKNIFEGQVIDILGLLCFVKGMIMFIMLTRADNRQSPVMRYDMTKPGFDAAKRTGQIRSEAARPLAPAGSARPGGREGRDHLPPGKAPRYPQGVGGAVDPSPSTFPPILCKATFSYPKVKFWHADCIGYEPGFSPSAKNFFHSKRPFLCVILSNQL